MLKVGRTPQAVVDVIELAEYIARDSKLACLRFIEATEATFAQLARHPGLGTIGEFDSPDLVGVRRWRIQGFRRYLVFYRETPESIEIVRVIHGSRDIESLFGEEESP